MVDEAPRVFGPNNGRFLGWLALIVGIVTLGLLVADGVEADDAAPAAIVSLAMVLAWAMLLRPALRFEGDDLVLRQAFSDVVVPLSVVEFASIRLFMVISTPERTLRSTAFSRTRRQLVKRDAGKIAVNPHKDYTDLVEQQINHLAEDARARRAPAGPITRTPAWVELVLVGLLAVAVVVLLVV